MAEIMAFPHGRHDDQVDALVHALAYLTQRKAGEGWINYMREEAMKANGRQGENR